MFDGPCPGGRRCQASSGSTQGAPYTSPRLRSVSGVQNIQSKAEEKVGFGIVRAQVRDLMLNTLGRGLLDRLRPMHVPADIMAELVRVEEFQAALQHGAPLPFAGFLDVREPVRRASAEMALIPAEDLLAVQNACACMRRLKGYFGRESYPAMSRLVRRLTALPELEQYLEGIVDGDGNVRDNASTELRRLRRLIPMRQETLRQRLRQVLTQAHARGYATEMQPTVRAGRMVIPLRAEAKRKIRGFVHDTSATGQTVYLEPEACLELNNELRILEAEERREVERILREATACVRQEQSTLEANLACMARIDVLQAKAQLATRMNAGIPGFNDEGIVDIRAGRNPVLLLYQGDDVIPLDLEIGREAVSLVITGPNAGGKTVAMKTVGLLSLMLQYGMPVPVHPASSFFAFRQILVEIGDEQSIENDLSTFSSRIQGLRRMLGAAGPDTLVLVDEIGTGTDPAEGAALAQATLEHLTAAGARTVVTTHHGTLKAFAHDAEGVENGSMEFDLRTLEPTFRFRQGVPGSSYAFAIAARLDLEPEVLERARALMGTEGAELARLMATFEERNQALRERLERPPQPAQDDRRRGKSPAAQTRRKKAEADATVRKGDARRRQRTEAAGRAVDRPAGAARFRPGDRVVMDGGAAVGEVLEIDGKRAVVAFGSMRVQVGMHRLGRSGSKRVRKMRPASDYGKDAPASVDLRGLRVSEALSAVEQTIDQAIAAGRPSVDIVHGKGTGALREAIHAYLDAATGVADFASMPGNTGLTRVGLA